jgi:hypothetical protein
VILLALIVLFSARRVWKTDPSPDGAVVYYNARVALRGQNPYDGRNEIRDWAAHGAPAAFLPGHDNLPICAYPPSFSLLIAPVAALPWHTGIRCVVLLNYLAGFGCLFFLLRLAKGRWSAEAMLLFAIFFFANRHLRSEIYVNQTTLLVCLPMLAGIYAFRLRREVPAGILIGLSLAKFTLTFPVLALLAYRREWKTTAAAIATFAVLNGAMAMSWGGLTRLPSDYRSAVSASTAPGAANDVGTLKYSDMISANHLVFVLFGSKQRAEAGKAALALVAACSLAVLLALRSRPEQERPFEDPLEIALLMAASLTLFYHRSYDLAALPIVLFGLVDFRFRHKGAMPIAWKIGFAALILLGFFVARDGGLALLDTGHEILRTFSLNAVLLLILFFSILRLLWEMRRRDGSVQAELSAAPAAGDAGSSW